MNTLSYVNLNICSNEPCYRLEIANKDGNFISKNVFKNQLQYRFLSSYGKITIVVSPFNVKYSQKIIIPIYVKLFGNNYFDLRLNFQSRVINQKFILVDRYYGIKLNGILQFNKK